MWPCPLPSLLRSPSLTSQRRRARFRLRACARLQTRLIVAAGNFLVCGRKQSDRRNTAASPDLSTVQTSMLRRFEKACAYWLKAASQPASALERALLKFETIDNNLDNLLKGISTVQQQLLPYGSSKKENHSATFPSDPDVPSSSTDLKSEFSIHNEVARDIVASRLKFQYEPSFNAVKYMTDPMLRAGFIEPKHLLLPEDQWKRERVTKVRCSKQEQLAIFKRWDDVNSLVLLPAHLSEYIYRCGLFAVYKSEVRDRQILNPVPENSRHWNINDATKSLAHACLLCSMWLRDGFQLRISASDLQEMYHGFITSKSHSRRNHIHRVFLGEEFKGFRCYNPDWHHQQVVGCFGSLGMGENCAVETAQHTHINVLRRSDAYRSYCRVSYRQPLPRGPTYQLVQTDDHIVIQEVPVLPLTGFSLRRQQALLRLDRTIVANASAGYKSAGLHENLEKAVCEQPTATVLGGHVNGSVGLVMAPPVKVMVLCLLTLRLVTIGMATLEILETFIGCWVYILLFRRPFMCLLQQCYHEGRHLKRNEVFTMSSRCKTELLLLVVFAPMIFTDLRASPLPLLFATDASPFAAGACSTPISVSCAYELFRAADHRGFSTHLDDPLHSYLKEHAGSNPIFSFLGDIFLEECIPKPLGEGVLWDCCEVFCGERNWSWGHEKAGLRAHPGFDILKDPDVGDFNSKATLWAIMGLILRRVILLWHFGPPCTTFGTMRRPRLRSKMIPFGFDPSDATTRAGNLYAMRTAFMLHLVQAMGLLGSCEQPRGSTMFLLWSFTKLLSIGFSICRITFCTYGSPFEKASLWLTNNADLHDMDGSCQCDFKNKHLRIQSSFNKESLAIFMSRCRPCAEVVYGRSPRIGEALARFSGTYPRPAMERMGGINARAVERLSEADVNVVKPSYSAAKWVCELAASSSWEKTFEYDFKESNHINIGEQLAFGTLVRHAATHYPCSKIANLQDSRVVLGCNAKGRSSSSSLNYHMSKVLPFAFGGNVYFGNLQVPSAFNPADDPSRHKPLRAASFEQPRWLSDLLEDDRRKFDAVKIADHFIKPLGGWVRLLLMLCGDIEYHPEA